MNDTSNKQPSVILAVVTLIVAITALGVVVWQTSLLNRQSRSLEERIRNARQMPTSFIKPQSADAPAYDGPTVIRYSYPEKRRANADEPVTYIFDHMEELFESSLSVCTSFAEIANDGSFAPSNANILDNENVANYIGERFGDQADDFVRSIRGTGTDRQLNHICDINGDTWVVMVEGFSTITLYEWTVEETNGYLSPISPSIQTMDLSYGIYPDINGQVMASTGYGDAGYFWWSFYQLDESAGHFDLVEDCNGKNTYDEAAGEYDDNGFEFTCTREYKP